MAVSGGMKMTSEPSEQIISEWSGGFSGQRPLSADPVPVPQSAGTKDRESLRATFERALECLRIETQGGDSVSAATSPSRQLISFLKGDPGEEAWVAQLMGDLKLAGFRPLPVPRSIPGDSPSPNSFPEDMAGGDQILVVCTPNSFGRHPDSTPVVPKEPAIGQQPAFSAGHNSRKTIVPLLLRGSRATAVPTFLRQHEEIDFRQASRYYEQALALFLTLLGRNREDPTFGEWMKLLVGTNGNPSESPEIPEPEEAIDPLRMRRALRRIGAEAAEAAAQVGQLVSVWRNGEVVLESPRDPGPPAGDAWLIQHPD
jgi:hypothetical protein